MTLATNARVYSTTAYTKQKTPTQGRGLMRQNTVPAKSQVRAQTPPDHAGVEYDDSDGCARICVSYWASFYDGGMNESRDDVICSIQLISKLRVYTLIITM